MTEQVRYRIESHLVKEAATVCAEIGISPTAAVSLLFAQMVKVRALPFRPGEEKPVSKKAELENRPADKPAADTVQAKEAAKG